MLRLTGNQRLVEQLSTDFTKSDRLDIPERAMLEYAARPAREPWAMVPADVEHLRRVGFSDRAILEINLAASYMSFVNRVAQGLGVEIEEDFHLFIR